LLIQLLLPGRSEEDLRRPFGILRKLTSPFQPLRAGITTRAVDCKRLNSAVVL
jgi:hypothetical protein